MNAFTIKDLENLTGIKAHTIRIWEQRYNFLRPQRTDTNIRYYNNDELKNWCETCERVIIETIQAGHMTKDLACCVHSTMQPERSQYLNTFEFIDKVAENLNAALGK